MIASLMTSWRSSLGTTFWCGTFNSFACANVINVIIYFFVTLNLVKKIFLPYTCWCLLLPLKIWSSSESLNMLHFWLSASVYLHSLMYTIVALEYKSYGPTWPWKFVLMRFFPCFQLTIPIFTCLLFFFSSFFYIIMALHRHILN